ncbi:MAG: hypothetical protein IJR85_03580 [Synergistaceae bacterium]|nr:hypothetical protein [Synergistaceae bacterium]
MAELIKGELALTLDIILGLLLGELIIRFKVPELLLKKLRPLLEKCRINPTTGLALAASAGSPKAGAAIISSALTNGTLTERLAIWSVLMLPLPAYLKRWPSTLVMAASVAGTVGGIFASSMLLNSAGRFIVALVFLRREGGTFSNEAIPQELSGRVHAQSFVKKLVKTLPAAWVCFALTYWAVPLLNSYVRSSFAGAEGKTFLPLSGWAVAAGSVGRVSSALALAGGAMASGELSPAQALFALILGNTLGTITRTIRMNAGYYFGFFQAKTAQKMLFLNIATILPFALITLLITWLAI